MHGPRAPPTFRGRSPHIGRIRSRRSAGFETHNQLRQLWDWNKSCRWSDKSKDTSSPLAFQFHQPMRKHFKLLLAITLVGAVFFAVSQTASHWIALGSTAAFIALAWAIFSARRGRMWIVRWLVGAGALTAIWFLAVDWSWFIEDCPDCLSSRDIGAYRVFGIPVSTAIDEDRTVFDLALADLGVPCTHQHAERWHKHRFWGLVICRCPCINGIVGLTGDDLIPPEVISAKMQELARNDPKFAANLHDRIVDHHDYEFFWRAFNQVPEEKPGGIDRSLESP
jgi:hypothetical protein